MNSDILNAHIPYATPEELSIIRDIAGTVPEDGTIVMIGAGPGVMLLALREGNPTAHITVIDIDNCRYAEKHLAGSGTFPGPTQFVISDSSSYGQKFWGTRPIDFLIIDGDHSYNGVKSDLEAWLPKIKLNGYLFLHDFDARGTRFESQDQYPGVALAVVDSELLEDKWNHKGRFGTAVVLRKESE